MKQLIVRRAQRLAAALSLSIATLGVLAPAASTPSQASLVVDGTCAVTLTVTAAAPIKAVPAFIPLVYQGTGTCAGYAFVTQTVQIFGSGSANVGCTVLETFGTAFEFYFSKTASAYTQGSPGVGTLSSVTFVMPGVNDLTFDGVGTFVWSNASQQTACAGAGTSTVTLTGTVVFQDPTLP